MEFKGTKGKWFYKEFDNTKIRYRFSIMSSNGDSICKILRDDNDNKIEERANAQLISKAPEMLEMLKRLKNRLSNYTQVWGDDETCLLSEAENLIKEATEI